MTIFPLSTCGVLYIYIFSRVLAMCVPREREDGGFVANVKYYIYWLLDCQIRELYEARFGDNSMSSRVSVAPTA